jgi:hypothetical protein
VKIAVAPHARSLGFDGSGRHVLDAYEVMDLREAIERVYATDAHHVCYLVEGATRQPRINKPGLPYFDRPVLTTTFVCDIDNPGHVEWNDLLRAQAACEWDTIPELGTCGVYHTLHGRHIIQPLAVPIPVAKAEPYIRRWLLSLESAGLDVDWACRDWTRHFRLANVVRPKTGRFRSPFVDLSRMRPIELEPIAELPPSLEPERVPRALRTHTELAWASDLPSQWQDRAVAIAKAIRESVTDRWHEMYLALGGALLGRGLPPERLPAMVDWIATAAGSEKPASHGRGARDTARRYADRLEVTGYPSLRRHWRAVAEALDDAAPTRAEARLRAQVSAAAPAAPPTPLAVSIAAMTTSIRNAPDGLTVISAECGLGKTNAAMTVARERAAKAYASPDAKGLRAPPQSKTAISVDKNALAIQIAFDLRARGIAVRRIFGPLSVVREDGTSECRIAAVATPLIEGGQPMQWVLCKDCEHRNVCRAKDGVEGPDDARITIGPHALLGELDAAAGSSGLLVIDEPPSALETIVLNRHDFADARDRLGSFEGKYALAMRPIVEGFDRWMDVAEAEVPTEPVIALRQALSGAEVPALVEGAKGAIPEERRSRAPPIQRADIYVAKGSENYAKRLGNASRVLGTLHRAVTSSDRVAVRVEKRGDAVALVVTTGRADLTRALKRDGSVVVTDANAELHLPVFEKIVGYAPRFHRFAAVDGAPITRTLLRTKTATRKGWFVGGKLALDAVAPALRAAIDWACEDGSCRRLGLITMRLLRLHLEAAWHPEGEPPEELTKAEAHEAREKLGPILREWSGEIVFGHYGAVRGLNTMADVDALVTLGDPWPNVGDARNDAAFLGLGAAWEQRLEAMCRAELEQAHGRIRAVHRARQGRALHVGTVLPSGYGWTAGGVEIRAMKPGPTREETSMDVTEFTDGVKALGGVRAAAGALSCGRTAISRYCAGARPVPAEIARELRSLVAKQAEVSPGSLKERSLSLREPGDTPPFSEDLNDV